MSDLIDWLRASTGGLLLALGTGTPVSKMVGTALPSKE